MELLSREQMTILMTVAGSEDPIQTARNLRVRWRYFLGLAQAARQGLKLDDSFPEVGIDPDGCVRRAEGILRSLDEWLAEQPRRPVGDI